MRDVFRLKIEKIKWSEIKEDDIVLVDDGREELSLCLEDSFPSDTSGNKVTDIEETYGIKCDILQVRSTKSDDELKFSAKDGKLLIRR